MKFVPSGRQIARSLGFIEFEGGEFCSSGYTDFNVFVAIGEEYIGGYDFFHFVEGIAEAGDLEEAVLTVVDELSGIGSAYTHAKGVFDEGEA